MKRETEEKNKIAEIDSGSAEMVFLKQELYPERGIDEAGVINLFSQAVWRFFEENRGSFAGGLGVEELDAVLADARILLVESKKEKMRRIEELIGLAGPIKIGAYLTVVKRGALPDGAYAVVEPGAVAANLIYDSQGKPLLFVDSGKISSSVYFASDSMVRRIGRWEWGINNVLEEMGRELLTDSNVNNEIYLRYINGEAGASVSDVIEEIFVSAFKDFEKGLAAALYNQRNALQNYPRLPVFLRGGLPLPGKAYKKRISYDGRRFGLKPPPISLTAEDLFAGEDVALSEELSRTVLQRIKWLMA